MPVTIYHNPRCAKSRETLALLRTRGVEPNIIEYLKTPPTAPQLKKLLQQLGIGARDLLRRHEPEYKTAGLNKESLTDTDIVAAMARYPKLIERPIVVVGNNAALGRPPTAALKLLKK